LESADDLYLEAEGELAEDDAFPAIVENTNTDVAPDVENKTKEEIFQKAVEASYWAGYWAGVYRVRIVSSGILLYN